MSKETLDTAGLQIVSPFILSIDFATFRPIPMKTSRLRKK